MTRKPPRISLNLPVEKTDDDRSTSEAGANWGDSLPASAFESVSSRRAVAFGVDLLAIGAIWLVFGAIAAIIGVLSFGLLWGPATFIWSLVPLLYAMITMASPTMRGTPGMRLMRLRAASWRTGEDPGYLRSFVMIAMFYLTVSSTLGLVLFVGLFTKHMRLLHDLVSDIVVINEPS